MIHFDHSPRLLVVDDDVDTLEILGIFASRMGIDGIYLQDSRDVVKTARCWRPDVIVLDIFMPYHNGFEVLEELARDPGTAHIPVVLLTAGKDPETNRKSARPGVVDFLYKPMAPHLLLEQVLSHVVA